MKRIFFYLFIFVSTALLASCTSTSPRSVPVQTGDKKADQLFIYPDGSMKFRDRFVDAKNVVIYPDGFGGERAALKMVVPLHPDYYRDSISVVRTEEKPFSSVRSVD